MLNFLNAIQNTPIAIILILVGLFIIILGFVTKIGVVVEVSPEPKRWAIPVGLFVFCIGLVLHLHIDSSLSPTPISTQKKYPISESTPENFGEIKTYKVGVLRITGTRQHACNVLLPRGPGIGGSFFYLDEAALWLDLKCEELYCNLSEVDCRTSLKAQWAKPDRYNLEDIENDTNSQITSSEGLSIVDQVIQYPSNPISCCDEMLVLSIQQVNELNNLFKQFSKVKNSLEPVEPGNATTYEIWNALCIGEQSTYGCPRSAKHEVISYGSFHSNNKLWTSRGWVFYKP